MTTSPANSSATPFPAAKPPLNYFQQLMIAWKSLGSYNAAHAFELAGTPDIARWTSAFKSILDLLQLNSAAASITMAKLPMEEHVAYQLNLPFAPGDLPLRASMLLKTDNTYVIFVFMDHWIADDHTLRLLMEALLRKYLDDLPPAQTLWLPSRATYAFLSSSVFKAAQILATCLGMMRRQRRSFRLPLHDPLDFTNAFMRILPPPGLITRIHARAKQAGATVNDAFIAALAQSMGAFTADARAAAPRRMLKPRRNQIAVGTVADVRDCSPQPLDNCLGCFLGFFVNSFADPQNIPLTELLAGVAAETRVQKTKKSRLQSYNAFVAAKFFTARASRPRTRALLFHRSAALAAGISNVNYTHTPINQPAVRDFLRVVCTGPLAPMVLALGTMGPRLSINVTYRTTAFSTSQAQTILQDFMKRLEDFAP